MEHTVVEVGSLKDLEFPKKDESGNNMLHLAAMRSGPRLEVDVPAAGAMFQIQLELMWFKEAESIMPASYKEEKNKDGDTPSELFTKEHKELATQAETWMKNMAGRCLPCAILVLIISSILMPVSQYYQNTGTPLYVLYVAADVISYYFAIGSILIFLSILIVPLLGDRFEQHDFLKSLPKMLIYGLTTLFLSTLTMMIAFSIVSFFVLYQKLEVKWMKPVLMINTLVVAVSVLMYVASLSKLYINIIRSTYGSKSLFKLHKDVYN